MDANCSSVYTVDSVVANATLPSTVPFYLDNYGVDFVAVITWNVICKDISCAQHEGYTCQGPATVSGIYKCAIESLLPKEVVKEVYKCGNEHMIDGIRRYRGQIRLTHQWQKCADKTLNNHFRKYGVKKPAHEAMADLMKGHSKIIPAIEKKHANLGNKCGCISKKSAPNPTP